METELESMILKSLITNEGFTRRVIPFLKKEYFEGRHANIFNNIIDFVAKYNKLPNIEALSVELQSGDISDGQYEESAMALNDLKNVDEKVDETWLLDSTEKWCQDRSIYLAIMESISVIDGKHKTLSKNSLPELLQDALAVSFDTNIGHSYLADSDSRFEFYHRKEARLPFDLEMMNRITKGGLPPKTLNCIMASSGGGKSLMMTHIAAAAMMQGKSVLYITMEMSEESIAQRVDANMLNISVDYINICTSSRLKGGGMDNSYMLIKSIAEELRGLAVENNFPIITATQTNRAGFGDTDVDMNNVSESFGLPATCDMLLALITTPELDELNQIMVKQLKNRYGDISTYTRFMLGIERAKMRLYDAEDDASDGLVTSNSAPVASTSPFSKKEKPQGFQGFKV